ncbi:MAG: BON domain-containing protein [Pseudomonadota bacterium]
MIVRFSKINPTSISAIGLFGIFLISLELHLCSTRIYLIIEKEYMMKTNLKTLLVIGALALPLSAFAAEGDNVKTKVGDAVITTKVKAEFAKDKAVSATNISVDTDSNGMVQLTGTAKSEAEAEQAVMIAKKVKGVTGVKNEIVVTP